CPGAARLGANRRKAHGTALFEVAGDLQGVLPVGGHQGAARAAARVVVAAALGELAHQPVAAARARPGSEGSGFADDIHAGGAPAYVDGKEAEAEEAAEANDFIPAGATGVGGRLHRQVHGVPYRLAVDALEDERQ